MDDLTDDSVFRAFMDACPVPVFLKSSELRYVYANAPMLDLVGMPESALIGASVFDVFPGSAQALAGAEQVVLRTGEPLIEEHTLRMPDGTRRRFRDTKFRVRYAGDLMLGVFRVDITEAAAHQFELAQAERLSAVGRLAAGIAHDYNNSLQSILAYAELVRASPDAETALTAAGQIIDEVGFSAALTASLMQFVRAAPDEAITADVNGTIDVQLAILRRMLGPDIRLEWVPHEALPPLVFEPIKMAQILTNLCINASDAMDGRGVVRIETHEVAPGELSEWVHEPRRVPQPTAVHVAVVVRDDGPGMDPQTAAQAFEPFFTTKASGTGLGLSTVLGIVRQYDGVVELITAPGRGAELRVLLPTGGEGTD